MRLAFASGSANSMLYAPRAIAAVTGTSAQALPNALSVAVPDAISSWRGPVTRQETFRPAGVAQSRFTVRVRAMIFHCTVSPGR
jgi:hypothetical protein